MLMKKDNAWRECQSVIRELNAQLSRSNASNAKLEQKYHNIQAQHLQLSVQNARLLAENSQLVELNQKLEQENRVLKEQVQEGQSKLAQVKTELVTVNQGKMKAETELGQLRRETANLKRSLSSAEERVVQAEEMLNEERAERQKEALRLIRINGSIKRNADQVQQDYAQLMVQSPSRPIFTPPPQKKRLQTATTVSPIKTKLNPQLGATLANIERDITAQCMRMEQTREWALRERVARTLGTIESLVSEMSSRVEHLEDQE